MLNGDPLAAKKSMRALMRLVRSQMGKGPKKSDVDRIKEIQDLPRKLPPGVNTKHQWVEVYHLHKGRFLECSRCSAAMGVDSVLCYPGYRSK